MVCVLVLSIAFVFASCEQVKGLFQNEDKSTTTIIDDENLFDNSYNDNNASNSDNATDEDVNFFGEWYYEETTTPKEFYGDFYDDEITKTNITLRTIYNFKSNGTLIKRIEVVNISEVRKEYRSLMVNVGRKKLQSQGKFLTTDDVLYCESYADKVLAEIVAEQSGAYAEDGNKLVCSLNGENSNVTFIISGGNLTLTSPSAPNTSITLTKL